MKHMSSQMMVLLCTSFLPHIQLLTFTGQLLHKC